MIWFLIKQSRQKLIDWLKNFLKNDHLNQSILLIHIRTTTIINYLCSGEYGRKVINFYVFFVVLFVPFFSRIIYFFVYAKPFIVFVFHCTFINLPSKKWRMNDDYDVSESDTVTEDISLDVPWFQVGIFIGRTVNEWR